MISILCILLFNNNFIYSSMTILLLIAVQLYIAILPAFLTSYTYPENRNLWYSRAFLLGYFAWALTTYLGGFLTVFSFSKRSGLSLSQARNLTKYLGDLQPNLKIAYLSANKDILILSAILAALAIFPVILIKEKDGDLISKDKTKAKITLGKDALAYLIYIFSVSFAMGLFSPYFTIFLNRGLHIDRSTSSLLISISYLAPVIFIAFTPKLVAKFGAITCLTGSVFLSLPFMLIIANGDKFGSYTGLIVGISLFLRSGFANLSEPVESALAMETVSKENRTKMGALVNILTGISSILAGYFTSNYLFLEISGYRYAYYIAALIYAVALSCLYFYFKKDYNFPNKKSIQ